MQKYAAKTPADIWKGVTSVAEWLSRKFGRKLDDVVPRPGSVSQEVFEAAPRPHTPSPDELILPPVNIYADAVKDLRRGGAPVSGGPGFHMPEPGPTNYAPPPTLGDAPRLPPVNMVDPPLSPTNRTRVTRPEPPPETRWYNPRDILRNIGGAPVDSPGLGGWKSAYRGGFKPRYPGLDRPLGENTSGFFNWSFNNPYNKPNWYARPFDRTRQSAANSLRGLNAAQLAGGVFYGGYTAGQQLLYDKPHEIAASVSQFAGLNEADEQALYESINGWHSLEIMAKYGIGGESTDDPFWRGAKTDIPQNTWDAMRRKAYEQNQQPYRWPLDALKLATPAGVASLAGRQLIADPVPSVPREKSRDFAGNFAKTLLEDPDGVRNSNLLAALRDIVPGHIHEKLMTRLYDLGVPKDQENMANALANLIEKTRGGMDEAGITNHGDLVGGVTDALFVPSKDPKREADLAGELTHLNNEVAELYRQVNDHFGGEVQQLDAARLYKEKPGLYVQIVANNKKKSEVITALRTLHPNYLGVDKPDNPAQSQYRQRANLDRALTAPAAQELVRQPMSRLGYEEMMAIIEQARNDPRFGQSNISPETVARLVKNYFTKKYNTNVPPTIRFK